MSQSIFIRASGWGLIIAAVCFVLTFTLATETIPFFLIANLLTTLGLVGLYLRYGERAGSAAKLALGIGIFGGIASVVTFFLMSTGIENGRILMNISMGIMFGGLFVFGLIAQFVKPMPRGNWLPTLAGFWWVFLVISAYVIPPTTRQNVPDWASYSIFFMMAIFLALLGYVLQADARDTRALITNA